MSTINDLAVTSTVSSADKLPLWSNANGVTRGVSLSVLDSRYITQDQINLLQISPTPEIFSAGDGIVPNTFVPGTSFSLILANLYGTGDNIDVFFDGTFQGSDQWSLTAYSLIFKSVIPVGTSKVYVKGGAARIANGVSNGSVTDVSVSTSSKLFNRINDWVDVKDKGAVGDGVTNDTAAVVAAMNSIAAGGSLIFPAGNYLCDPMVFSNFNFAKIFGFDATITLRSPGTLMTFHNAQRSRITGLTFQSAGAAQSLAASCGVLFDQSSGTCQVDMCNFFNFSFDGLQIDGGTLATGLSGFKVMNNYFQGNGRYQLWMRYSNDWHIDKNQYGIFDGLPSHAQKGCFLQICSAGRYTENLHWNNGVGFHDQGGNYNSYANNRIEMSDQQNVILENCNYGSFIGNQPHTASEASPGTSDNMQVIGSANMIITGNNQFSFEPNVHYGRYGINIDAGCSNITLGKNRVGAGSYNPAFGPYRLDGTADVATTCDIDLSACSQTTIGPSSTVFMGSAGTNTVEKATFWVVPRQAEVMRLLAAVDTAPGASQTFIYTVRVNGVSTSMSATITGSNFAIDVPTPTQGILIPEGAFVTVQLVTSAGAASAFHRISLSFAEY